MLDPTAKYTLGIADIVLALIIGLVPTIALIAIRRGSAADRIVTFLFSIGLVTFLWALLEGGATGVPFYVTLDRFAALLMISAAFLLSLRKNL